MVGASTLTKRTCLFNSQRVLSHFALVIWILSLPVGSRCSCGTWTGEERLPDGRVAGKHGPRLRIHQNALRRPVRSLQLISKCRTESTVLSPQVESS